jgi:6-pyruvoyltetrahydropterin/6-carboxytetrahydropterin synthase
MTRKSVRNVAVQTSVTISSAHSLHGMGKCEQVHGHNWVIDVEIMGTPDMLDDGVLVDFSAIKSLIKQYDHKMLNDLIERPTAENIALHFVDRLGNELEDVVSIEVKVWESEKSCATAREIFYEEFEDEDS